MSKSENWELCCLVTGVKWREQPVEIRYAATQPTLQPDLEPPRPRYRKSAGRPYKLTIGPAINHDATQRRERRDRIQLDPFTGSCENDFA